MKACLVTLSLLALAPFRLCHGEGAAEKVLSFPSIGGVLDSDSCVAFSPDGTRALHARTSGMPAEVCRLDGKGCKALEQGIKGAGGVPAWSPDGKLIAVYASLTGGGGAVQLWSGTDLKPLGRVSVAFWPKRSVFSPDSRLLAVSDDRGRIEVFSVPDGKPVRSLSVAIGSLGFSFAAEALHEYPNISWVHDGPAKKAGVKDWSTLIAVDGVSASGRSWGDLYRMLMGEPGTEVRLVVKREKDSDKSKEYTLKRMPTPPGLRDIRFTPDSRSVFAACGDGTVKVWSLETGRLERTLGERLIETARVSGDGGTVLALMEDGDFKVYSPDSAEPLRTLVQDKGNIDRWGKSFLKDNFWMTFDGKVAMSGKKDLYDGQTRHRFFSTQDGGSAAPDVAGLEGKMSSFSPDGRFLALHSSDRIDIYRNPASPHRFVREAAAALTSATGKVLTRLPAGTAVEVLGKTPGHLYVRLSGGLKGYLAGAAVSVAKPDVMKPMVRLMESLFQEPLLKLKGVVYDDVKVSSVIVAGTAVPRAAFVVEEGNYEDAYPFEAQVSVGPGSPMSLVALDSSGKTTELPINIEEPVIDYQPRYAQLEVRRRSLARKAPVADAPALSALDPKTVVAALGEKDGWYHLEGGGWLAREDAREMDVYAQPSSKPIVFAAEQASAGPRIVRSVSDVDVNIPERGRKAPDAVAVVIGIRDYKNKDVPPVAYALDDARVVREYLIRSFGVPEENILYLENPTQGDLARVFGSKADPKGQLSDFIKPGKSDVFVYYSGHGAPDLETHAAYFVPADAHPNYVKLNGYPLDVFYENLSQLKARSVTAVIDSCFSGASHKGMLVSQASPLYLSSVSMDRGKGLNVFTSSANQEISSWFEEKNHSLFTYYFLKAVQEGLGKGGALSNGQVRDSISERLPGQARKLFGRTQTPAFSGDADAPLLGR